MVRDTTNAGQKEKYCFRLNKIITNAGQKAQHNICFIYSNFILAHIAILGLYNIQYITCNIRGYCML